MNRIVRIMLTNCHAAGIYWNFAGNNLFSKATVKIQNPHYKKISIINLQLTAWNNKIIVQHATRPEQNLLSCKNNLFKLGAWIPSYSNHLCVIYTYEQTKLPSYPPIFPHLSLLLEWKQIFLSTVEARCQDSAGRTKNSKVAPR